MLNIRNPFEGKTIFELQEMNLKKQLLNFIDSDNKELILPIPHKLREIDEILEKEGWVSSKHADVIEWVKDVGDEYERKTEYIEYSYDLYEFIFKLVRY